jgi:predicted cupin superfamily sugar epimerase
MTAPDIIEQLQLQPHPEGGFYKETYRAGFSISSPDNKQRNISTAIYYLLQDADKSHFHRIKSDECWFFHEGQPLEILTIQDGQLVTITLGKNLHEGETLQAVIPAGIWFAARVKSGTGFGLVSCTVAPGFDFADFEMAERAHLSSSYPGLTEIIIQFTRG